MGNIILLLAPTHCIHTVCSQYESAAAALPVCVEQVEIKWRFTSITMTPTADLITTTLTSLKCAAVSGDNFAHVLFLHVEHINMD